MKGRVKKLPCSDGVLLKKMPKAFAMNLSENIKNELSF